VAFVGCTATLRARAEVCNQALAAIRLSGDDVSPSLRLEFYRIRAVLRSDRDVSRRRKMGAVGRVRAQGSSAASGSSV
jgi:hypothetical protein